MEEKEKERAILLEWQTSDGGRGPPFLYLGYLGAVYMYGIASVRECLEF